MWIISVETVCHISFWLTEPIVKDITKRPSPDFLVLAYQQENTFSTMIKGERHIYLTHKFNIPSFNAV